MFSKYSTGDNTTLLAELLSGMPSIDEIDLVMVGQDREAVYAGRCPEQIVETMKQVTFNQVTPNGQDVDYSAAGYDLDEDPEMTCCNPLICHPLEVYNQAADKIMADSLSEDLLLVIEELSRHNTLQKTPSQQNSDFSPDQPL